MERRKRHIVKLEGSIKKMSEELLKGNEIIKKLQNDIRNYHAKVSSIQLLLTLLFLTFLDHLLVQGRPVFQSSSIFDIVPCLQSVGTSSCLPLRYPSIYFSVDLCSFSRKLLVLAILHRCGCVLASNSGQTTSVFCFPGKFQQVLRAPPS